MCCDQSFVKISTICHSNHAWSHGLNVLSNMQENEQEHLVFLGGSCNPTTWRQEIVIPYLLRHNIPFFNPQVENWSQDLIEKEEKAKKNAYVLFFVIDDQTRAISSMVETAYLAASNQEKLISVINSPPSTGIAMKDQAISGREHQILKNSRNFLFYIVRGNNLPVFVDINAALEATVKRIDLSHFHTNLRYQVSYELGNLNGYSQFYDHTNIAVSSYGSDSGVLSLSNRTSCDTCNTDRGPSTGSRRSSIDVELKEMNDLSHVSSSSVGGARLHSPGNGSHKLYRFLTKQLRYLRSLISIARPPKNDLISSSHGHLDTVSQNSASHEITLVGPGKWKNRIAIPMIKEARLCFKKANSKEIFSPKNSARLSIMIRKFRASRVLLFVIPDSDLALETLILASHCIGLNCKVFLCIQQLNIKSFHKKYQISKSGFEDYNRGRAYLTSIAQREGIKVFSIIQEAVQCAVESVK